MNDDYAPGASLAFAVTLSVANSIPTVNLTVWRPSNGTWYVNPINAAPFTQQWGLPGDIPVAGDFNHNGAPDYVVWRPSNGTWYVTLSVTGTVITKHWEYPDDIPVSGDFDGDGISGFCRLAAVQRDLVHHSEQQSVKPSSSNGGFRVTFPSSPILTSMGRPITWCGGQPKETGTSR